MSFRGSYLLFLLVLLIQSHLNSQEPQDKPFWVYENGVIYFFDAGGYETDIYPVLDPEIAELDLNSDGYEELIVTQKRIAGGTVYYSIVIFDGDSVFSFVDSLYSGVQQPEVDFNSELNSFVITSGNPVFDSIYLSKGTPKGYNPQRFYLYDGEYLVDISADVYEDYMKINEALIDEITGHYSLNSYICETSEKMFGRLVTIVLNYIAVGEMALAEKYFDNFYNCPDSQILKSKLKAIY